MKNLIRLQFCKPDMQLLSSIFDQFAKENFEYYKYCVPNLNILNFNRYNFLENSNKSFFTKIGEAIKMNLSTSRSQKLAEKYEIFPNAIILHIVSREETKCYEIKFSDKITSYFDLIHFDDERKCIQCVNVKFLKIQGLNSTARIEGCDCDFLPKADNYFFYNQMVFGLTEYLAYIEIFDISLIQKIEKAAWESYGSDLYKRFQDEFEDTLLHKMCE